MIGQQKYQISELAEQSQEMESIVERCRSVLSEEEFFTLYCAVCIDYSKKLSKVVMQAIHA